MKFENVLVAIMFLISLVFTANLHKVPFLLIISQFMGGVANVSR